jgi:phosphoglycerate kinase
MINYINPRVLKKFRGKTCILRVDLNVGSGKGKKSLRVEAILPTLRALLRHNIRVVILSHRGRPRKNSRAALSLKSFALILSKELKKKVKFIPGFPGKKIAENGQIFLLENLRFYAGEDKNSSSFAKKLSALGDFYINEAFAFSHRKTASMAAITRYLPSYGGFLLKKEVENLSSLTKKPKRPFVVIIGGAKVGDKLGVISYFWRKADYFLLGSGPAATFFAAQDLPTGESFVDKNSILKVKKFIGSKKLVLPLDVKTKDKQILDIGPETGNHYSELISKAKTIIWNGPLGLFEKREWSGGTKTIWRAILKNRRARIIVGGGETLASLRLITATYNLPSNVFLSTGGGAMLEYLSGRKLPGIEALK